MKTKLTTMILCALAAATPAISAQATHKDKKPPSKPGEAAVKSKSAAEVVPLTFVVTGLTKDNAAQAKAALEALSAQDYACPTCGHREKAAGQCPKCKVDLKLEKETAIRSANADPTSGEVRIQVAGGHEVSLRDIEASLAAQSIKVDEGKLMLPGPAVLVLGGVSSKSISTIEKALREPKLYSSVQASFDSKDQVLRVRVAGGKSSLSRRDVIKALETSKATLSDVVWKGPAKRAT